MVLLLSLFSSQIILERIEEARRNLSEAAKQGIDQIEMHEILGEGAVSALAMILHCLSFCQTNICSSIIVGPCSLERSTGVFGGAR